VLWLPLAAHGLTVLAQAPGTSLTPIDSASESVVGYILGFGPLGIVALAMAWLLLRGWRLVPPGFESSVRDAARADARADLIAERDRIITEKQQVEDQRDEALQVARDQLLPLLVNFTASTQALLPILQGQVAQGKPLRRGDQKW
jgi:hypothetical protein